PERDSRAGYIMSLRTMHPNGSKRYALDSTRRKGPYKEALEAQVDHPSRVAQAYQRHVTRALAGEPDQGRGGEPTLGLKGRRQLGLAVVLADHEDPAAQRLDIRHLRSVRRQCQVDVLEVGSGAKLKEDLTATRTD